MIYFPNAKINIGLSVLRKMENGYHKIESLLYPVGLCDILEIVKADTKESGFSFTGIETNTQLQDNLCYKAWLILSEHMDLPPLKLHLHKLIPAGAGLGGGSSDAAFTLKLINEVFSLKLQEPELIQFAASIGSDCPFFIPDIPALATGRGDIASPVSLDLSRYYIAIIYPHIPVSTAWAYRSVIPEKPKETLKKIIESPINEWKDRLHNDFENVVFNTYPEIGNIKKFLYKTGAVYASLSGSGSAVYGLFSEQPDLKTFAGKYFTWSGRML